MRGDVVNVEIQQFFQWLRFKQSCSERFNAECSVIKTLELFTVVVIAPVVTSEEFSVAESSRIESYNMKGFDV